MESKPNFKSIAAPPALRYSTDVVARMKATGVDAAAAESRLASLPRDQAENTWANVTDYYRRSTDMASKVAAYQGADKSYQQARLRQPANESWTAFDDMGSTFKNSFVDLAQGVADFIPSSVDLAMSALSNPTDDSWYRKWDAATDAYFEKAKYYVSPEAQAAVYDDKTGLNWRALAGMTGSTLGFMTTTMLPMIGAAGRAAEGVQAISMGSKVLRMLTDPRLQSGAIGYLQALPGYKEAALKAGYTRNQAALIAPVLSTAQSVLEFAGADALMKGIKLAPAEAMTITRQLSKEAAADAFKQLAGKPLTEETFRTIVNQTGKGFFSRLRNQETRDALLQNIKAGAISEATEEGLQQGAESSIQKLADIYYGYDQPGGKGFDPTVKQTVVNGLTGILFGGVVGGSMGGMFGRTPTYVGQQTVWGLLDGNVRDMLNKHPDLSLDNNKEGLAAYRLTDKLLEEGKLDQQEYAQARSNLDRMVNVSARLAKTSADAPTRFALYNLDTEQQQWQSRIENEVAQPMKKLQLVADERAPGQWFPKPGLSALDLAEAQDLINQNIPYKAKLAESIQQTIDSSVTGLMNPQTRQQALKTYKPALDALADQWENGPSTQEPTPARPDQFSEQDLSDVYRTMDTPDGRFAVANTPDGRQVFRVETKTEGRQDSVSEDKDPTIGRFRSYKLPSKGQPVVSFHTIADATRHGQLLSAFDSNADVSEPYQSWRDRLSSQYRDNDLDGLRQAEAAYQEEADTLAPDAPEWQKEDVARKKSWLKGALASRAADSSEDRYGWSDWMSRYLDTQMQEAGITPDQLAGLPAQTQSQIADALQSGDYQQANELITKPIPPTTANDAQPTNTGSAALPAQIAATAARQRLIENAGRTTREVLDRAGLIDEIEQALGSGKLDTETAKRLIDQIGELERALDAESDAIGAVNSTFSLNPDGSETGAGDASNPGDSAAQSPDGQSATSGQSTGAEEPPRSQDEVEVPKKRKSEIEVKVIDRQAQDIEEGILQYFVQGNRMRRSDLAHYGDPNLMRSAKGGNPYLRYTTGDDKALSLDQLARTIWEENLGRDVDQLDEQAVMQAIIDTVQSFATTPPKQQLITHQQATIQDAIAQADADVVQATAATPLEVLEPLMVGMDQAQVPVAVQDQIITLIAENYITPEGLDWVGVIHLFRHNHLFDEFDDLHRSLVPYMSAVVQPILVTEQELASETESSARLMSNEWWAQTADQYQLTTEQYNQLIDDFYGQAINSIQAELRNGASSNQTLSTDEEGRGLPGSGDQSPRESRDNSPDNQPGETGPEITLTDNQQAQVNAAQQQLDADIAVLERDNERLERQAENLRKQVRNRSQTVNLFTEQPVRGQPGTKALSSLQTYADQELAKLTNGYVKPPGSSDVYFQVVDGTVVAAGQMVNGQFAPMNIVFTDKGNAAYAEVQALNRRLADMRAIVNGLKASWLSKLAAFVDQHGERKATDLLKSVPGGASAIHSLIVIPQLDVAKSFQAPQVEAWLDQQPKPNKQAAPQADLFAGETSGIDAQDSAKARLADIEAQIAANNDRIANLKKSKEKISEIITKAPAQAVLFHQDTEQPSIIGSEIHQNLLDTLRNTFTDILDDVHLINSEQIQQQAQELTREELRNKDGIVYGFVVGNTLYLNSDVLNANTPIHELGHIWNRWAKAVRPDLHEAGVQKVKDSPYFEAVANNEFYRQQADRLGLHDDARTAFFADEALASAIGDEGEKFVKKAARKGFLGWLDRLWSAIKDKLGIESKTAEEIGRMDLADFAGHVAARLLEGRKLAAMDANDAADVIPLPLFSYGPKPSLADQPASPIQNQGAVALTTLAQVLKKGSGQRQALLAQGPTALASALRQTFEPMIQDILQHAPESVVANQLLKIRANGRPLADPTTGVLNTTVLNELAMELVAGRPKGSDATGRLRNLLWEGAEAKGIKKLSGLGSEPDILTVYRQLVTQEAIIDEDGNYEWPDKQQENSDLQAAIDVYTDQASDPLFIRLQKKLLTSKWASTLLLPETVGNLFSLGESTSLHRLTKDIFRAWSSRAAEVRIRRDAQLDQLSKQLQGLSKFASPSGKIGDISSVKQLSLPGWVNGQPQTIDIPVADWLDIYFTIRTQLAATSQRHSSNSDSSVLADLDAAGQLIGTRSYIDSDGTAKTRTYGYQYTAPGADKPSTLLISHRTYQQLETQLQAEHADILQTVADMMADPVALSYVSGIYQVENGYPLPLIQQGYYYPTQSWQSAADRAMVPTVNRVLEEARFLQERKASPAKVVGQDILARLTAYATMEGRYIGNSTTRLNLTRWRQRNADVIDNAPKWLTSYLEKLEKDLNDPYHTKTDESPFEFELAGVDVGLRAMLKRFSQSTFGFNLTTPLTQFTTAANLYGLGIIQTPYLNRALPLLAKLGVDAYTIARQSSKTSVLGRQLAEVPYMEKLAQNPYMSSIVNRIAGRNETYLGQPTLDDLKAQPLDATVAALRKLKNDIADPALRWVRAADRAVVLFMAEASRYQIEDQIANAQLLDDHGHLITDINSQAAQREIARLTEEAVYSTNTMPGEGNATPLQRSQSIAGTILGLYSGQQTRLLNSVLQSIDAYLKARAVGDLSVNQLRKQAIWTALNLLLFNSLAVGLIHLLYRFLTGLLTGQEPEEEVLTSLSLDVARGILGSAPSLPTEVMIAASTWVDGPKWEDGILDYAPAEAMKQTITGLLASQDYFTTDDPVTAAKRFNTLTYSLVSGSSNLSGLPGQLPKLLARMARQEPIHDADITDSDQEVFNN